MVATLYLCSHDFEIKQDDNILKMCTKIPGMSMVCFYSTQCEHCADIVPIFKQLPLMHQGCQFGLINVGKSRNYGIIKSSQPTNTPLTHVPLIIMYINGEPYMKFDDNPTTDNLIKFINHVSEDKQLTQTFTSNDKHNDKNRIGTYRTCNLDNTCKYVRVCELDIPKD